MTSTAEGRSMRRLLASTAAATFACAALFLPAQASAKSLGSTGGVEYIRTVKEVPTDGATVRAACPGKKAAVAGGFAPSPYARRMPVFHSFPYDDGDPGSKPEDGWAVHVSNYDGTSRYFFVWVLCKGSAKGLTYPSNDNNEIGVGTSYSRVDCGEGSFVNGGGARITYLFGRGAHLNSTNPFDDGDANAAHEDGWESYLYVGNDSAKVTAYAICRATKLKYRSKTRTGFPAGWSADVLPRCPAGTAAVGGGAFITGDAGQATLDASYPFDGADADEVPEDGWVSGFSNRSGEHKAITGHAVCKPV